MDNDNSHAPARLGTPYAQMSRARKLRFVAKLALCILTFGFVFPNIMFD